jgi:hypothetical protein
MALKKIGNVDKELLAARYKAAVMKEFRELATWWFKMPLDDLIAKSGGWQGLLRSVVSFFLKTDEIVTE